MARKGECIDNPLTHQRIEYTQTAADTGGETFQMRFTMFKGAFIVGGPHLHPAQTETFRCEKGRLRFVISGKQQDLVEGEEFTVHPRTVHDWWNPSKEDEAVALVTFHPAKRYEKYFETIFGLARDGKAQKTGFPKPLQAAVIYHDFRESVRAPKAWQRAILAILLPPVALLGKAFGLRSTYSEYEDHSTCGDQASAG
jgi:quercetin dioxygenase-like cupin family protein